MQNIINPSYNHIHKHCIEVSNKLKRVNPDCVVAMMRGGMLAGKIISHALHIPMHAMDFVCKQSAGDNIDQHIDVIPDLINYKSIVLVDDIADTGEVMKKAVTVLTSLYPDLIIHTYTIYVKQGSIITLTNGEQYHSVAIPANFPFINFPWELTDVGI
jgi:hypoxanthine phosphoribosyltransferase